MKRLVYLEDCLEEINNKIEATERTAANITSEEDLAVIRHEIRTMEIIRSVIAKTPVVRV